VPQMFTAVQRNLGSWGRRYKSPRLWPGGSSERENANAGGSPPTLVPARREADATSWHRLAGSAGQALKSGCSRAQPNGTRMDLKQLQEMLGRIEAECEEAVKKAASLDALRSAESKLAKGPLADAMKTIKQFAAEQRGAAAKAINRIKGRSRSDSRPLPSSSSEPMWPANAARPRRLTRPCRRQ